MKSALWLKREHDESVVQNLSSVLGLSKVAAAVLAARGIVTEAQARRYLDPSMSQLADPSLFAGMEAATTRLAEAILKHETIGICGDYDVDGVTSTTLLWEFLQQLGAQVVAHIPNRLRDGYGLSQKGVDELKKAGASLIITVDCGITAHDEIEYAVANALEVIVIDHHTVPVSLPQACAVVNPHRADCLRGGQHLCAVAVTFNVCIALRRYLREKDFFVTKAEPNLAHFLDLVALGTVADIMPLIEDNRIYVKYGLQVITKGLRPGMQALLNVSGKKPTQITAGTLGFQIGPRINAAGRLEDAMPAVNLLRSQNAAEAMNIARILDEQNQERQQLQLEVVNEAIAEIDESTAHQQAFVLVVHRDYWHPGVVGIAASKLVEKYGKPAIVIGTGGKGSGRSIPAFHLHDALCAIKETMQGFGGHAHAVGVHIDESQVELFRAALIAYAQTALSEKDLCQHLYYDEILTLADVDMKLVQELEKFAPYGRGNPECLFRLNGLLLGNVRELKGLHISGVLNFGAQKIRAIGFGLVEKNIDWTKPVDILAVPEINEFNGNQSLQLRIKDVRRGN